MEKKTLHIIPHSHWDREWYMGFDRHRVHLVELFDTLIDLMEKHPDYTYYHMDGQFIVIEDYLEIKPEMKDRLYKLIRENRIQIGPWYVLQDEYLTSGESNVRNMLYGIKLCRSIGADPVMCGYFPDSFGNVSQIPQILNGFGIDNAVFGRGLNDLGSDNAVVKQNGISNSELLWQSPDGSEVIGVMYANWYHNAMELPMEPDALKDRIHGIVESTSRFAATDQLLGMNGCDHQPVQTNLHEVIKLANEVQDEVTVKQSNFKDYIAEIRPFKDRFRAYRGEINGQYTAGFYLLINTASCRVDIKQKNHAAQNLLARTAEPLNVMTMLSGDTYKQDFLFYAWRKLMQNHPHDSICSCSADDVYDEMLVRFQKSMLTADEMKKSALDYMAEKVDTLGGEERNIILVGLEPHDTIVTVKTDVDFDENDPVDSVYVTDEAGNVIPCSFRHLGRTFTYTLPKDRFRQPKHVNRFSVELLVKLNSGLGYRVLHVHKGVKKAETALKVNGLTAENEFISVSMNSDGTFRMTDKRSGRVYENCNYIEDLKDQGNTYLYGPVDGDTPVTNLGQTAEITVSEQTDYSVTFCAKLKIAIEADITTYVTVYSGIARADIQTVITNRAENHRIRAMFPAGIPAKTDLAEGQFDLVRRDIYPWEHWQNPYNTQRCTAFFAVESEDQKNPGCLLVANRGLNEYEIMRDTANTMAQTLLRCVGEIGDWGDFPTPKAQMKGTWTLCYAAVPYTAEGKAAAYAAAYDFSDEPVTAIQTGCHGGVMPKAQELLRLDNDFIRMSAMKKAEADNSVIFRAYNISEEPQTATLTLAPCFTEVYLTGMDEQRREKLTICDGKVTVPFGAKKILTFALI